MNASRIAVALEYDRGNGEAPRVTAKGHGHVADRILETAREHGVAIEDNAALAAALSLVELDESIPPDLYAAVAQVIGFVLHMQGYLRR